MNQYNHLTGDGNYKLDEAWWASLLADEEHSGSTPAYKVSNEQLNEHKDSASYSVIHQPIVDWDRVQGLYEADETIELNIVGYNRGGLLAEGMGIHGFIPISHLIDVVCDLPEEERDDVLADYVGQSLTLKVIECDHQRGRVVFSERAAQAITGRRNQLLLELKPGECVSGIITNITDFGVFVDLGGVEGLVHVSEISWGRVRHPNDLVEVGQRITAHVIQVDRERARIALSLKRLCNNPWETAEKRYQPGQVVTASITSIAPYGAFARIEEGLDGLIHVSEMGLPAGVDLDSVLVEGQEVQARILHIDASRQRLGLGLEHKPIAS